MHAKEQRVASGSSFQPFQPLRTDSYPILYTTAVTGVDKIDATPPSNLNKILKDKSDVNPEPGYIYIYIYASDLCKVMMGTRISMFYIH